MAKKTETVDKSNLSIDEQIALKKDELVEAKRGLVAGTLQNPHSIGVIKKEIARLLTKKREDNGKEEN